MSSVTESGGRSSSRMIIAVILAIVAILFIVVGFIYLAEPAKSLPSVIPGHLAGSTGHHPLRSVGSFVVGVILLVAAWFALRYQPKSGAAAGSRESTPAGQR